MCYRFLSPGAAACAAASLSAVAFFLPEERRLPRYCMPATYGGRCMRDNSCLTYAGTTQPAREARHTHTLKPNLRQRRRRPCHALQPAAPAAHNTAWKTPGNCTSGSSTDSLWTMWSTAGWSSHLNGMGLPFLREVPEEARAQGSYRRQRRRRRDREARCPGTTSNERGDPGSRLSVGHRRRHKARHDRADEDAVPVQQAPAG